MLTNLANVRYLLINFAYVNFPPLINVLCEDACSSSMDSLIRVWDLEKGVVKQTIEAAPVEAWTVAFSPDARHIATGSQVCT